MLEASKTSDYLSLSTKYEGQILTLTSITAIGLTMEDLKEFYDPKVYA